MAFAKSVCSDCGAGLSPSDNFCPQCGVRIDRPSPVSLSAEHSTAAGTRCGVCGVQVDGGANFCESCGAALKTSHERSGQIRGEGSRRDADSLRKAPAQKRRKQSLRHIEPWQVLTGGVVIVLVGFFVYNELSRDTAPPRPDVKQNFPVQPGPSLQDIENQQAKADADPRDAAAWLRLANMLHDAALHDSRFLMRAINAYTKYLVLSPSDPNARVDMGICYFELARVDSVNASAHLSKAIEAMKKALQMNPDHQPAAFNLGIVNLNAGDVTESAKWFTKAVEINPNSELGRRAKELLEQHSSQGLTN